MTHGGIPVTELVVAGCSAAFTKLADVAYIKARRLSGQDKRITALENTVTKLGRVTSVLARGHQEALRARMDGADDRTVLLGLLRAHERVVGLLASAETDDPAAMLPGHDGDINA